MAKYLLIFQRYPVLEAPLHAGGPISHREFEKPNDEEAREYARNVLNRGEIPYGLWKIEQWVRLYDPTGVFPL